MFSGIAGGFQPCFRHVGTHSGDRRQYEIAPPVFQWHKKNERYLLNRTPVAAEGLVWSQSSADFYGRDSAGMLNFRISGWFTRSAVHTFLSSLLDHEVAVIE